MPTRVHIRSIAAIFAVIVLGSLTSGCSSTGNQTALNGLRGLVSAARPDEFSASTAHDVEVQRHVREHALPGIRSMGTLHHQSSRNL